MQIQTGLDRIFLSGQDLGNRLVDFADIISGYVARWMDHSTYIILVRLESDIEEAEETGWEREGTQAWSSRQSRYRSG